MGLVAEFKIHCDALPLVDVAAAAPDARIVLHLQFNHGDWPLFLVTVTGGSEQAVTDALTETYDVGEWTRIGQAGETRRYQVEPALSFEEQLGDCLDDLAELESLATAEAFIERIVVEADGWRQTGWFADRAEFRKFSSFWQANADFQLDRLTRDESSVPPGEGLTNRQDEALRIAYERGYFEIPRQTSLEEIAAELDITASSVTERLRRAQTQLIEETVATTWPTLPD
jgi:hypothetical protein